MRVVPFSHGDSMMVIYYLDKGELIPRHNHPWSHLTTVVQGRAEVEIWGETPFAGKREMVGGDTLKSTMSLPAVFDHEIRALDDGTIIINTSPRAPQEVPAGYKAPHLIKMANGTYERRLEPA